MTQAVKAPLTYVVKKDQPIDKYVGYEKDTTYVADENLGTCDCIGYTNTAHCKHLLFKALLSQFGVEELVFFGETVGACKPKPKEKIMKIALNLWEPLTEHFKFTVLEVDKLIPNPADSNVFNCIEFKGKRSKPTLVVGYTSGVMFLVKPI